MKERERQNLLSLLFFQLEPVFLFCSESAPVQLGNTDTHSREVTVSCATATLGPNPGGAGVGTVDSTYTRRSIAFFGGIRLESPPSGTHIIAFSSPFLEPITLAVTVVEVGAYWIMIDAIFCLVGWFLRSKP